MITMLIVLTGTIYITIFNARKSFTLNYSNSEINNSSFDKQNSFLERSTKADNSDNELPDKSTDGIKENGEPESTPHSSNEPSEVSPDGMALYFDSVRVMQIENERDVNRKMIDDELDASSQDQSLFGEAPRSAGEDDVNIGIKKTDGSDDDDSVDTPTVIDVKNNKLGINYYILLSLESLCLSGLVAYLILSKMNKKLFREVFSNRNDIIIYSTMVTAMTLVFTIGCIFIIYMK